MKSGTAPTGLLGKILAALFATVLLAIGFLFSVVLLAIAAVLAIVGLGYFWWKTRAIRRVLREQMAAARHDLSTVIEGEATVVRESPRAGNYPLLVGDKVS